MISSDSADSEVERSNSKNHNNSYKYKSALSFEDEIKFKRIINYSSSDDLSASVYSDDLVDNKLKNNDNNKNLSVKKIPLIIKRKKI